MTSLSLWFESLLRDFFRRTDVHTDTGHISAFAWQSHETYCPEMRDTQIAVRERVRKTMSNDSN
jgi:hypothetical protein